MIKLENSEGTASIIADSDDLHLDADTLSIRSESGTERVRVRSSGVGINSTIPRTSLDINDTDALVVPVGTTGERPTPAAGMFRYNTTEGKFEG